MQNTRRPSRQPMTNFTQSNPCADYSDKVQVKVCTPTTRHVWNWRWTLQTINAETLRSNAFITSQPVAYEPGGVGAAVSPGLKNSGQTLFLGQAQVAQKFWKTKTISIQWKISGQIQFFRARAGCSKFWMIKIYIHYSEFRAHPVFQGKHKLLKNP